ncbi:MAG: hypothetical protein WAN93_13455 [Solirubrobacteraceae bacterium]
MPAEIRRINEGDGETVAALWDEQARTEPDGAPLPRSVKRVPSTERPWTLVVRYAAR